MRKEPEQPLMEAWRALSSLALQILPGFLLVSHPGRQPRGGGRSKDPSISIPVYRSTLPRSKDNSDGTASR